MIRPISCTMLILGLASIVQGETTFLNPSQSVQAAIDQASPGDTIVLGPGTYQEAIDFQGKAITIKSADGPDVTVLDASSFADTSVVTLSSGEGPDSVLEGLTITGGSGTPSGASRYGGGMYVYFADATVRDCVFTANSAPIGGGVFLLLGDLTLTDCRFVGNEAGIETGIGGGALQASSGSVNIARCSFVNNDANAGQGGALYFSGGNHVVTNSLFDGNDAFVGGGISTLQSLMWIANCTFVGNSSVPGGGAAFNDVGDYTLMHNSILWGNGIESGAEQMYVSSTTTSTVQNCNIMGGWPGNMNEQPSFADEANHDYRLAPGSPCINMGDESNVPDQGLDLDLLFNPRLVSTAIDLGAYEFQDDTQEPDPCASDVTGDGQIDVMDMVAVILAWGTCDAGAPCPEDVDGNGVVDVDDLNSVFIDWEVGCP